MLRPDAQALNWKAAIPVLGLAAACFAGLAQAGGAGQAVAPDARAVADFTSCAKHYPAESLRRGDTGVVTLAFLVGANGRVADSKVNRSSGFEPLDVAAREAIALCRFKPAIKDGAPAPSWTR